MTAATLETFDVDLAHGITLSCRAAGAADAPLVLFLHGFPEGAFAWEEMLVALSDRYRCVAPNLRGFEQSSAPAEVAAYKPALMVQDVLALAAAEGVDGRIHTLVAHDWGGAFAWAAANAHPTRIDHLVIINSPHPATFARELQGSAEQQQASAYMNFLARPDAEALLAEDDFRRLFAFFNAPDGSAPAWLTDAVRQQYRALWQQGLTGACNYYRASPLRPPRKGDAGATAVSMPTSMLTVPIPTLVLWGMEDPALLPSLLDGLQDWVPQLQLQPVAGASHWLVHEQPAVLTGALALFLQSNS